MKKKKLNSKELMLSVMGWKKLFGMVALAVILGVGFVAGAPLSDISLTIPADSGVMTGSLYCLNATTTGDTASNVTFYYRIGSSGAFIPFAENETANAGNTKFGNCIDTTSDLGGDAGSYQINVTAFENDTSTHFVSDTNTGIFVDNVAPTVTFQSDKTNVKFQGQLNLDCSKSSDSLDGSPTYSIVVTKPGGDTLTSSESKYLLIDGDLNEKGFYSATCTVTDHASLSTTSSDLEFKVVSSRNRELLTPITVGGGAVGKSNVNVIVIVGVGLLLIFGMATIVLLLSKKR